MVHRMHPLKWPAIMVLLFFLLQSQSGPAAARYYGVKKAKGDILLFIDSDVLVQKGSIARVVDYFLNHPEIIEDIELGYRLRKRGYQILLDKDLQVKHLKKWT